MSVKRYSVWDDEMFEEKHALNATNGMVHLVVKYEDYSAIEQKLTDMAVQLANAESKCRELAAENAKLKVAHPQPFGPEMMKALDSYEKHQDEVPETGMLDAFFILRDSIRVETPATDAFLAEVRVQGVEELASLAGNECKRYKSVNDRAGVRKWKSIVILCSDFAAQIRKGAKS